MATIERLVGVYDADGTLRGELTYFVGARLGRAHCALCDITHGFVRERRDWQACRDKLLVPVLTVHRDEVPPAVAAAGPDPPFVAAETDNGVVPLLDGPALEACQGDPDALVAAIEAAVDARGLDWPATHPLGS
jgi:hypothetical protein